ncbi:MAG: hypothetical protein LBH03_02110 [Holophagales bacterium]|jgi:hypothetical protein|nr:hypothetical protein [Holophagales bacterium]
MKMFFTKFRKILCIFSPVVLSLSLMSCGGSKTTDESITSSHSVTGTITYKRLPIKIDASSGYPRGLDTDNVETLPLRGITVRAIYSTEETMPDDSKVVVWNLSSSTITNSEGEYTLTLPDDDTLPVYVEVQSSFSSGYNIRLIADPAGMNESREYQADRVLYSIRRGLDGSEGSPTPAVVKEGKTTLDFEIGLDDKWWIGRSSVKYAPDASQEYDGTGSRVAAIIDTVYKAATSFGNPTPGYSLDLHYRRGITEPLGTYVEYDRERLPLDSDGNSLAFEPIGASSGGTLRYFGSVRGGPEFDDAWDEGALLSMMARNMMRSSGAPIRFQFPSRKFARFDDPRNQSMMTSLQPTMAMAEGLPDAIAAIALKTPYLTAASGTQIRDIRDVVLPSDIYSAICSAPVITAFTWELALKANDITPPGIPEVWDEMENLSINRFYSLQYGISVTDEESGSYETVDLPSLFTQLATLSYAQSAAEPINLPEIFTDEVITEMTTEFFGGEIWPRPDEGPLSCFIIDWGNNPDSAKTPLPEFTFSMSDAVMDAAGNFSNLTFKENFTARLNLSQDTAYWLSVSTEPALPNGASIEVRINGSASPYIFSSYLPDPQRIVLLGYSEVPIQHMLDFSLKSPSPMVFVSDTRVNVQLKLAY